MVEREVLTFFDERYKSLDVDFSSARVGVPDGHYEVIVTQAYFDESKSGQILLKWELEVTDPSEYKGALVFAVNTTSSDASLRWLKKNLIICGLHVDRFSDLYDNIFKLKGIRLSITQKTNGDYRNVYFGSRLEDDSSSLAIRSEVVSDNDIPF